VTSAEVIRRIAAEGWTLVRTKGSHQHFKHADRPRDCDRAPPKKDPPVGTLKSIEKQSGVKLIEGGDSPVRIPDSVKKEGLACE
jgi:predicted RNA binding protein YcfA (HicA-like mRNA interferase family)